MATVKFGTHLEHLWAVAGSRSGRLVAVAGERAAAGVDTSKVHVYRRSKLEPLASFEVGGAIAALDFAKDDLLIAGGDAGELRGFSLDDDARREVFAHRHAVGVAITALASDASGERVAVVDDSGHATVYAVGDGGQGLVERSRRRLGVRPLRCVAFDSASDKIAAAGDDGVVRVFAGDDVREMPTSDKGVTALVFTGDGRIIAGCGDGTIRVSYLEGAPDEEDRSRDDAHNGAVTGLVLGLQLHDEAGRERTRRLLSVGADGLLKAWIHDTRRKPRTLEFGKIQFRGMAWLAPYRAKPEREGGTLLLVDSKRRLHLVELDGESSPNEAVDRLDSHLAKLAAQLDARKLEARAAAVAELRDLPEDSARTLLDRVVRKSDKPELRKLACEAIAAGKRRRSRDALRAALRDRERDVRFAAFAALEAIEGEGTLPPVRAALGSNHADLRRHAVERLPGLRGTSPLVPGLVADRLRDEDDKVRAAALEALCQLEPAGSLVPLRTAYEQGPADVRVAALSKRFALLTAETAGDPDPTGRELLEDALDDPDSEVRETAFLLSVGARPRLAGKLWEVFKAEFGRLTKLGVTFQPSGGDPGEDDLAPLFAALACRFADTALRGALSLAVLGDGRATGALLQLSREADANVRRRVADAIAVGIRAMPDDDRLAARLQWLLDDPDGAVRTAVFDNLQDLAANRGDAGALDLAELALGAASQDMRVRALQVLVEFGGSGKRAGDAKLGARANRLLGDALDDEADKVRGEAFRTLWAWHAKQPRTPLTRGARSRHADIRTKVVGELDRVTDAWADDLLVELVGDSNAGVGKAAFEALTKSKKAKDRVRKFKADAELYLAAMASPRPSVRALGAHGARKAGKDQVRKRLIELLDDEHAEVHIAAIETIGRILAQDQHAWTRALGSKFIGLRVRAAELCGKRRDDRALTAMRALLTIPESGHGRPSPALRHRAARAAADVGARSMIAFFVELLDDGEALVREEASRGLATACERRDTQVLLAALSHDDLPVRSWIAEGLARLGDVRAVPVLVGTLAHDHRPIRLGAILSLAALGPDGARGLLRGLEDRDREILDLVFAIVVARDVARLRSGVAPDLMLAALASSQPEIRFAAARCLEERRDDETLLTFATELVGPRKPDRSADLKKWPEPPERAARLRVIVDSLASDDPSLRYAAARVLSLRTQPLAFWREAGRLKGPKVGDAPTVPQTNWEDGERREPRRSGWIRKLIGTAKEIAGAAKQAAGGGVTEIRPGADRPSAPVDLAKVRPLVFGAYAGLVRQAPAPGEADQTHRVRRDSIDRLGKLATTKEVGRDSVMPVLRRALSDPHHIVRRAAVEALRGLYETGAIEPLGLCLQSSAADVGKGAIDELVQLAMGAGDGAEAARAMALTGVDAPNADVRGHALLQIQKLFETGSLEPWFVALGSQHADLRLSVVDRLVDARDERVSVALLRAMESDHEDLRLKAASALARRGDLRTLDVLGGFLRAEDKRIATRAVEALVALARHRRPRADGEGTEPVPEAMAAAAEVVAGRLEDDPDRTADRGALIGALRRIGDAKAAPVLLGFLAGDDAGLRARSFDALVAIARDDSRPVQVLGNGVRRARYHDARLVAWLTAAVDATETSDPGLREKAARTLRDADDPAAEGLLARLLEDREETVRVAACEVLAFRAEWVEGATLDALVAVLQVGRRELVLPAAEGMASRGKPEAFQPLLLVLGAGHEPERRRAILALGRLGDPRALSHLERLLDPEAELTDEDRALASTAVEALGALLAVLTDVDERGRVRDTVERAAKQGSGQLRLGALAGLRRAGDARSRTLLETVAGERLEPEAVRVKAIDELGSFASPESEDALAVLLSDNAPRVRKAAHAALERVFPSERTRTALLALRSTFAEISAPAAGFLAKHGDPEVLVERMVSIDADDVRRQLRRGLVRRGECPAALAEVLASNAAGQRADAAWIAGAGGEAQADRLGAAVRGSVERSAEQWRTSLRTDPEGRARAEAAWRASLWAAAQIGVDVRDLARAVLTAGDRSGDRSGDGSGAGEHGEAPLSVQRAALRYLGRRGDATDVSAIEASLSHRDAGVRTAAGASAAALVGRDADEVLERLTVADQVAVAPLVAAALDGGAGERMLETAERRRLSLPRMLGDARFTNLTAVAEATGSDAARLTAIASLGRLGSDRATAVLQGVLDRTGEPEKVRKAAFRALRRAQRGKTTTATREAQA